MRDHASPADPERPRRRRRPRLLLLGLALAAAGFAAAGVGAAVWSERTEDDPPAGGLPQALRIPPLVEPRVAADGAKVFDLRLQTGETALLPGRPAETWGINGTYLGPTVRAARGDRVVVRVRNDLPEDTTMHWHGMHLPAAADGGPHQPIEPGETWEPSWTVDQPAATLWYHPHPHERTTEHVLRGLAGMFIVDDDTPAARRLPRRYGVDDVPVIVQDPRLTSDGELQLSQAGPGAVGPLGKTILVNGTSRPYLDVRTTAVRLRLLNASPGRTYRFVLAGDRTFTLVATDGGLLHAPAMLRALQLSPGERAEVVVPVTAGERVMLRSERPDLGVHPAVGGMSGAQDSFDVLELRARPELEDVPGVPRRLASIDPPAGVDTAPRRSFRLAGLRINGRRMDPSRIDQVVRAGATEVWEVSNDDPLPHNFHVHGVSFLVRAVGGAAPPPHLRGWKDTVYVRPDEPVTLAVRFTAPADPRTPYMFHCHLLQHEDVGMMGQVVVSADGRALDRLRRRAG